MEQGIKFTITGDTKGLENAANKAENELDGLGNKINQLQKDIADNIRITQGYERAIEQLSQEFKSGRISQDQYAKSLARLQRDEKETIVETDRLRKELRRLQQDQKSLAVASNATGQSIGNLGRQTSVNANPALQEFSRVIQDAPFGIIGVGNNIQQLVANFGNLSRSAGGTGAALRAMLGAISGPGGILLAVSAATTLLTVFSDELFSSANAAEKLQEEIDGTNELFESELAINQELEKSIELQGKSTVGILGTRKELINNQIESLGLLIQQQQELLNIQILENQTVSNWEALVGLFNQAVNGILGAGKAMTFLSIEAAKTSKLATTLLAPLLVGAETLKESSNAQAANNEDLAKQRELQIKVNELIARQLELQNQVKETNNEINEQIQNQIRPVQIPLELDTSGIQSVSGEGFSIGRVEGSLDGLFKRPTEETQEMANKLLELQNVASSVQTSMNSAFNSIASGITNNLSQSEDGLERFGAALLANTVKVLGAALSQSIANSILGATQGAVGTGPLAPFTQPGFIASMVAGVISAFAAIPKFAQGGIIDGGSFTGDKIPILANSGERILTVQDQSLLTRFLRGETMGSTNQTGGLPTLEASAVIRGSDIYLAWNRAERNNKRYFGR